MKKKKNTKSDYYKNSYFDDVDDFNNYYMNEISGEIYRSNIAPYDDDQDNVENNIKID